MEETCRMKKPASVAEPPGPEGPFSGKEDRMRRKTGCLLLCGILLFPWQSPVLAADFEEDTSEPFVPFAAEPEEKNGFSPDERLEAARLKMKENAEIAEISAPAFQILQQKPIEGLGTPLSAKTLQGNAVNFHELKQKVRDLEKTAAASNSPGLKKELEEARRKLEEHETVPVYRLYNPNSGEHFYTPSTEEREALITAGWKEEGVGWQGKAGTSGQPVYRLYNPNAGDHHYTPDEKERQALIDLGWVDEEVAWYGSPEGGTPVYRTYNPNAKEAGAHHFTLDQKEYTTLGKSGWVNEGPGFYVPKEPAGYSICEETVNGRKGIVWYDNTDDRKLTGSQTIEGSSYYFEPETGFMLQNRLFKVPDTQTWRVFGPDGKAVVGSVTIDGKQYGFYGPYGDMVLHKNMVMKDGSYYRLREDGTIDPSAFRIGGVTFTPDADGKIQSVVHDEIPRYMQNDPRWKDERFGNFTFGYLGCLPTTMTSVLNYFGGQSMTPIQTGRLLEQQGYFNGSLPLKDRYPLGGVQQGILWLGQTYDLMMQGSLSEAQMKQILLQGGVVALSVGASRFTSGDFSHEILVYGYDHGNVMVHDPLTPHNSGVHPLSSLYRVRNRDRYGIAAGGPVFGFLNPQTGIAVE